MPNQEITLETYTPSKILLGEINVSYVETKGSIETCSEVEACSKLWKDHQEAWKHVQRLNLLDVC